MKELINMIKGAVILHNLLTETNAYYEQSWVEMEQDPIKDDMDLERNLEGGSLRDDKRRVQIMDYFAACPENLQIY